MDPDRFRFIVLTACVIATIVGLAAGALWAGTPNGRKWSVARFQDGEFRRWASSQAFRGAWAVVLAGVGSAALGAYFYGRPHPWASPPAWDRDALDALLALGGVVVLAIGAFLLGQAFVDRRPKGTDGSEGEAASESPVA